MFNDLPEERRTWWAKQVENRTQGHPESLLTGRGQFILTLSMDVADFTTDTYLPLRPP